MNIKRTRRPRRYRVKRTGTCEVELRVFKDCWLGNAGEVVTYLCWSAGGYVSRYRGDFQSTQQVCERLHHTGSTLMSSPGGLLECIRGEARACLREQSRDEARY